jgi:hypothetical protein
VASASILGSTKKALGIEDDNTAFDVDILIHINAVLSILNQIGIGPEEGFAIEDDTPTWEDFFGTDPRLNMVQQYVYLKTRVLFDPPQGSYHLINSMNDQITQLEWRLSVKREGDSWVPPTPPPQTAEVIEEVIIVPIQDAWTSGPA